MYQPFILYAHRLLRDRDETITFVDVGSRNGVLELASLAEFVHAFGFEPNPDEYKKLVSGKTDASRFGIHSPRFRSLSYAPYALADESGKKSLYVTLGPGAAGMLPPNEERLREIRWKGETYKRNFGDDVFPVEKTVEVEVKTLQDFAKEKSLSFFDYLKIDVEGSEYEVLRGAGDLLHSTGVIKVEVCFIPFRKGQKLFSHADLLLRDFGFDLLKYEISPAQIGFKERTESWSFGPTIGFPERYGQPLSCDAIYVNRSLKDPKRILAQAMVLLEKNYLDEALFILQHRAGIEEKEFFELLRTYRGNWRARIIDFVFRMGRRFVRSPQLWK